MEWMTDGEWKYSYFPIDEPSDRFGPFQVMVDLWRSKADHRSPHWTAFSMEDLRPVWGRSILYDAVPGDPHRFWVRLWGTAITRLTGYDLTGTYLTLEDRPTTSDFVTVNSNDLRFNRMILDEHVIGLSCGPLRDEWGSDEVYTELLLPLRRGETENDQIWLIADHAPRPASP